MKTEKQLRFVIDSLPFLNFMFNFYNLTNWINVNSNQIVYHQAHESLQEVTIQKDERKEEDMKIQINENI